MKAGTRRAFAALAFTLGIALGCSSNSAPAPPPDCHADPAVCPAGETCWPVDDSFDFGCVASAPSGTFGASCLFRLGMASCGDGMACDTNDPQVAGVCTLYCSASKPCPAGYVCGAAHVNANGPTLQLCRAGTSDAGPTDAGADH
jgi:hypothetical protein